MIEVYWYISKAKLDLLKDASPAFLRGISATASFRLPGFEGNLSGAVAPNLVKDLQRVVKRLEADQSLKHYHELGDDEAPVMMRFEGQAVTRVSRGGFWLAMECKENALLLAGSVGYAIGHPAETQTELAPSIDPVGSFLKAYEKDVSSGSLSGNLCFIWRHIMGDFLTSGGALPRVAGLAVFARTLPTDKRLMRLANRERLKRLVIGSPLYVQRI